MKQTKRTVSLLVASCSFSITVAQHPEPQLVKDIVPGSEGGMRGYEAAVCNNKLFFGAYADDSKIEPWISDGTEAGTTLLKNIAFVSGPFPFEMDSHPEHFTTLGSKVLFVATYNNSPENDRELFVSNGTTSGTILLANINTTFLGTESDANNFCNLGDRVVFMANDGLHGNELWVTDGLSTGTHLLKDIVAGSAGILTSAFFRVGSVAYFTAYTGGANALWATDGTIAGTNQIKAGITCQELIGFDGKIFMLATSDLLTGNWELWTTDGTDAGTLLFKDINSGTASSSPSLFTVWNDKLYFVADDGIHGQELWSSDGTVANTQIVKDIFPGTGNSEIGHMLAYEDKLFFRAEGSANNSELWATDGTDAGTQLYAEIKPGSDGSWPSSLITYNGRLYFAADSAGYHYYCIEGVGKAPFKVIPADSDDAGFGALFEGHFHVEMNGSLYFPAMYKSDIGWELYKITTTPYEPTSIKNIDMAATVSLYPNPFHDEFTLTAEQAITTISIVNVSGKTVWQHKNSNKAKTFSINTRDWMNGIYFVKILTDDNSTITKTIVKY